MSKANKTRKVYFRHIDGTYYFAKSKSPFFKSIFFQSEHLPKKSVIFDILGDVPDDYILFYSSLSNKNFEKQIKQIINFYAKKGESN